MNFARVARLLSGFTLFFSLALLLPLAVAVSFERNIAKFDTVLGFGAALAAGLVVSGLLRLAARGASTDFFRKESLAVVGLAWLVAGTLGAVPFLWSRALAEPMNAVFESLSGLTTTGASVFGGETTPAIESLPASLLLWRSLLHWLGGLGIVLVFIVLLPAMGVTGSKLLSSEQVGIADESNRPRLQQQGRQLLALYSALTLLAVAGYALAGMSVFDALCHSFATMATGGFSTKNASIGGFDSVAIEWVAIVFMFLAGTSFVLMASLVTGRFRNWRSLFENVEFRVYFALTAAIAAGVTLSLWLVGGEAAPGLPNYDSFGRCVRDATFQAVSLLTSTGFGSADFDYWPMPAMFLLVLCMLIGGSTGSTAGGFKVLRVVVCGKLIAYSLRHFVQPRTVDRIRIGDTVVSNSVVSAVLGLALMWLAGIAVGGLVLSMDSRLDLVSAVTASVSMMGCTGPALSPEPLAGIDLGPTGSYAALYPVNKAVMCLQMVLGRLEILAPLVLLTPGYWRH